MIKTVTLSIDDTRVEVPEGTTLLEAADSAAIYIPRLCSHPNLPPATGSLPVEFVFVRDYNLCIGCLRCVQACRDLRGIEALGFVYGSDARSAGGDMALALDEVQQLVTSLVIEVEGKVAGFIMGACCVSSKRSVLRPPG